MKKIFLIPVFLFSFLFITPAYSHAQAESLYIRTTKSYVEPGTFYDLTVLSSRVPFVGYTGLLDVTVTSCNQSGYCNTTTGPWGNHSVQNGSVGLNISADYAPSRFRARFKPRNSTWDWSNEIQVDVGMTQDLENSQDYWLLSSAPAEFTGYNFADNKNFKTVIGFKPPENLCGETVQSMYFMKNDVSGYWDPHNPWYDTIRASGYDKLNLMWHLAPWQKKAGWNDEYLTAIGHEIYQYNPTDPFNQAANFQVKTGQYRNKYPNYILSAKWVGAGWGVGGRVESYQAGPSDPFCSIATSGTGRPGTWVVHTNLVNLTLPKYSGPALQYKFYEGGENFVTDTTKWGLREDWYFVKNKGLVKIEAKYFGPTSGVKPCQQDDDCLMNEIMTSPHIRLVRSDLLPTPTPVPGDFNGDGHVNQADYDLLVANFGNPYTIFDYNTLVGNFGH